MYMYTCDHGPWVFHVNGDENYKMFVGEKEFCDRGAAEYDPVDGTDRRDIERRNYCH